MLFNCTCKRSHAQSSDKGGGLEPQKIFGEVNLLSNYVEKGLTQSDEKFSVQATLGYRWVYFKAGMQGSSVTFPGNQENVNLKAFASYQFIWTQNADMTFRYDYSKYFASAQRDGNIFGFDINLFTYHMLIEKMDNWQGTKTNANYFGFRKDRPIPWNLIWDFSVGYTMLSVDGYNNYFDVKTGISYKYKEIGYSLNATYTSAASQLNGAGDLFGYVGLHARF